MDNTGTHYLYDCEPGAPGQSAARGLSPHQFTPMSGAHQAASVDAPIPAMFHTVHPWRRATQHRALCLLKN